MTRMYTQSSKTLKRTDRKPYEVGGRGEVAIILYYNIIFSDETARNASRGRNGARKNCTKITSRWPRRKRVRRSEDSSAVTGRPTFEWSPSGKPDSECIKRTRRNTSRRVLGKPAGGGSRGGDEYNNSNSTSAPATEKMAKIKTCNFT